MMSFTIKNHYNKNYSKKLEFLINEFVNTSFKNEFEKEIEFIIPYNFNNEFFNQSSKLIKTDIIQNGFEKHNGIIILPEDVNFTKFIVLFDKEIFESFEYFSTVIHELTHIQDYIDFFNDKGNIYKGIAKFDEFYFWTEFNAKKQGLRRFLFELEKNELSINLEKSTQIFVSEIIKQNSFNKKIYLLVHYLARLSLYDENKNLNFDNSIFPEKFLYNVFGKEIRNLYFILTEINNYYKFNREKKRLSNSISIIRS